ncbi:homocysteine S-methyltransferase family protein [Sorangium sp. So ce375]|uniref:homocysteine S-methyltransferase family protein n=1 Tax=Sorangium sp. So ce375 TaxID=3133306 RepID=UPI003F5C751B
MNAPEASTSRPPVGRPLIIGGDPLASLRGRGTAVSSNTALGRLLRESPRAIAELHEQEIALGIDVVRALTSATTTRALAPIGMAFRAAALTGTAVELATEAAAGAAARRVAVAGILGHTAAAPMADRIAEDYAVHAARLAAAGCEILVACGFDPAQAACVGPAVARLARRAAVVSASTTQLATWALVELDGAGRTADGEGFEEVARAALDGGADALLFEVVSLELGLNVLRRLEGIAHEVQVGMLLGAESVQADGADRLAPAEICDAWAASAARLIEAGARMLGGGTGTTLAHLGALAKMLRTAQRAPLLRRAL